MTPASEIIIDSQYLVCPAGSRAFPDLEKDHLPAFESNILLLLLLVSCF